jgi:Na+/proline symporter
MDQEFAPRPIAGWYIVAAVASLLFMGLGCISFLMHIFADRASLPLDQQAAFTAEPLWVTLAYAVAVWAGLAGAVLLIVKRKAAEWALLISLIAVLAWLAGLILVAPLRESMSANDLLVALIVTALTWTIYWFARHSRQRGWLR